MRLIGKATGVKMDPDIAIILPTYCEAENISDIVRAIEELGLGSTLLVIDDSSPDGTQNIVRELNEKYKNIILLSRPSKTGLGTAIIDGFRLLLSQPNPPKYIITMDADHSHNSNDIPRLLDPAKRGYDVVVGSRYCEGGKVRGWTVARRIISETANKLTRMIIKLSMSDFTSGFRCYSKRYVQKVLPKLHSQTYEIQIETIRQAKLQNSRVGEVPITFENRKKGKSKLALNEIIAFSGYILKTLWEQLFES
jgi:dolichol-phosphate mannosyltransferase